MDVIGYRNSPIFDECGELDNLLLCSRRQDNLSAALHKLLVMLPAHTNTKLFPLIFWNALLFHAYGASCHIESHSLIQAAIGSKR